MSATISVDGSKSGEGWEFAVVIAENGSESKHNVILDESDYIRITDRTIQPEELVEKSFEFLLEREPKESILRSFNITVIGTYFPDYESSIKSVI